VTYNGVQSAFKLHYLQTHGYSVRSYNRGT